MRAVLFTLLALLLVGCGYHFTSFETIKEMTYHATVTGPNRGYIDYRSPELLAADDPRVNAIVTYAGAGGPFDLKKFHITGLRPQQGELRLYVPEIAGLRFVELDLNVNGGTVRLCSGLPDAESAWERRLEKEVPVTLVNNGKSITVSSAMRDAGPWSVRLLRAIRK
ncbi:hypothetical protein [Intestinirhabdus alba]|jgi:hypothetical protein|uniref:Lipoprotein n=1 Tax=Intestinirhabdus alba TaxID=2899544 RepID=A0A6L6IQ11_9ENTR|nr:hypothetical protein [Intestinirhabdus alba]MTH48024.1 hypothetical protein [Intestinirhabdus alba]